jgi:phosphate/sulfate permease
MSTFQQWLWPDVSIRRNAQAAISEAFWVTSALAAGKIVWFVIALLRDSENSLDTHSLIAGICFAALALGLHFRSPITATLAFVLNLSDALYSLATGHWSLPFVQLAISLALFAGIRGTLAYRKFPPKSQDIPSMADSFKSVRPPS